MDEAKKKLKWQLGTESKCQLQGQSGGQRASASEVIEWKSESKCLLQVESGGQRASAY